MQEIAEGPKRLTKLAVLVNTSAPETSRHLERLGEVGITEKNIQGGYSLAPIGQIIIKCLPSFEFVARQSDYLRHHDLSRLPPPFISRLGDLLPGELRQGELSNIKLVLGMLRRAEKSLRLLTLESFRTPSPDGGSPLSNLEVGLDYKLVVDQQYRFPGTLNGQPSETLRDLTRVIPSIPAASVVTEKEAAISFPERDGKLDYSAGFYSTNKTFMGWCSDLIEYLWSIGEKMRR